MDISKEYIKMCEHAREIQGKHCRGNLDEIFFHKDCVKMFSINGFGFGSKAEVILEVHHNYCYKSDIRPKEWNDYCIWLPRQDQLQEIILDSNKLYGIYGLIRDFSYWIENTNYPCDSMEQLWLRFVMGVKYNKVWNGEEWVKNGVNYD